MANLDIKTSVNRIGEIINLSQELNSKIWDNLNSGATYDSVFEIYKDIAQLDVMSNLEIDSAKRENPADNVLELKNIKDKYTQRDKRGRYIRPLFFKYLDKDKGFYDNKRKAYRAHKTSMDYLELHIDNFRLPYKENRGQYMSFVDILKKPNSDEEVYYTQVNRIVDFVREAKGQIANIWQRQDDISNYDKYIQSCEVKNKCAIRIDNITLNNATMHYLLRLCEMPSYSDISYLLFSILFSTSNESFWDIIVKSKEPQYILTEEINGEIQLFNFNYCKTLQF